MTRWDEVRGDTDGGAYAERFAALEASGVDVHGEAEFCSTLIESSGTVLDAGCGTGRVAIELARRGYSCVGVDIDPSMLAQAETAGPGLRWVRSDLAVLDLGQRFDLVICAGNVIPLVTPGTEPDVIQRLAEHLGPSGRLVAGFGLDAAHLPLAEAPFGLPEYDAWCDAAGLVLEARYTTWGRETFDAAAAAYAVSVHTRPVA